MVKKALFILILCSIVLVACGPRDKNAVIAPDDNLGTFRPVCYPQKAIGMWIYARSSGSGNARTGYGFGMRMTDEEYRSECLEYR